MSVGTWIQNKFKRAASAHAPGNARFGQQEFVVLDLDLTGNNASQDAVTGLAALLVSDGEFRPDGLLYHAFPEAAGPADSTDTQNSSSYHNIMDLTAGRVLVTINPNFVRHMLEQAAIVHQLPMPKASWLDLAAVAKVIGSDGIPATSLNRCQETMRTKGRHEHDAVYDVFAMAHLLQALLAYAEDSGIVTMRDLQRNQSAETWLRPH